MRRDGHNGTERDGNEGWDGGMGQRDGTEGWDRDGQRGGKDRIAGGPFMSTHTPAEALASCGHVALAKARRVGGQALDER